MADKQKKNKQQRQQPPVQASVKEVTKVAEPTKVDPAPEPVVVKPAQVAAPPVQVSQSVPPATPAKKFSYNPERAKAYRDKIKAAAIAGGHVFKEKGQGTGHTVKKVSKTGKEYYYQPWDTLTAEQKEARLASARERSKQDRELAAKYKLEHPELAQKGSN